LNSAVLQFGNLVAEEPHGPAGDEEAADKKREALQPVTNHFALIFTLRDAENDGSQESEDGGGAEV
jgi:hypothetical protein